MVSPNSIILFNWNDGCEAAFLKLKKQLTLMPILVALHNASTHVLDTDTSDTALRAMLHVIAYASCALSRAERRYCITHKELLGVVYFLKKYRQHLLGWPIVVCTNHAALTYLMKTPEPIGQQG